MYMCTVYVCIHIYCTYIIRIVTLLHLGYPKTIAFDWENHSFWTPCFCTHQNTPPRPNTAALHLLWYLSALGCLSVDLKQMAETHLSHVGIQSKSSAFKVVAISFKKSA